MLLKEKTMSFNLKSTDLDAYKKLLNEGQEYLLKNDLGKAEQVAVKLFQNYPETASTFGFIGSLAMQSGRFTAAEDFYTRAIGLTPNDASLYVERNKALLVLYRYEECLSSIDKAMSLNGDDPNIILSCAMQLSHLNSYERALELFTKALEFDPQNSAITLNIAMMHRSLGNLEEAEEYADKSIKIDPNTPNAFYARSDVRKVTEEDNHIQELEMHLAKSDLSKTSKHQCLHALAKEYEDIGEYGQSFENLQQSNSLRRHNFTYNVQDDVTFMTKMAENFSHAFFRDKPTGYTSDKTPIFVLGLPRAGSTLLERILGGHEDVTLMGERTEFDFCLRASVREAHPTGDIQQIDFAKAAAHVDFEKVGQNYLDKTSYVSGDTSHCLDKLPANYIYAGPIQIALPNAKIIHIKRNPMDACYAMYKMIFAEAYPFSYTLDELAAYYIAHHKLMAHWRDVLPTPMLEVNYEDLVEDTEETIRQLTEGCNLSWNSNILDHQSNTSLSTTASAAQIRQPIYKTAVERWRHYENQLEPLRKRLEEAGIEIN